MDWLHVYPLLLNKDGDDENYHADYYHDDVDAYVWYDDDEDDDDDDDDADDNDADDDDGDDGG